uniref:phosphoserine phosphatase n=1 Tax=Setaria italica TaxID=4555 RepID=K3Z978_SETIT
MAQLNGEQIYPAQLIYIPQVSSVRLRTNSGLPRALRKPMSHQVKLSSHLNFIPAALEAYKSASSSDLENNQPSKHFCGAGQAVAQWTAKAMAGSVAFEEALAAWLSLFKPSIDQVQDCIEKRPPRISNGISELIEKLKVRNTDVYLVSGGFQQMIKSVALELGVPHENIFANQLLFGTSGEYVGFDPTKPTSRSGGKAVAVQHIRQKCRYKSLVMIGDGATDLEARQPGGADLFICYGGAR